MTSARTSSASSSSGTAAATAPDALLIALSTLLDGTRQRPRHSGERPGGFLRSRLEGWFNDAARAAAMTEVHEP